MKINKPHFELTKIMEDETVSSPLIIPITQPPWEMNVSRRGFLTTGLAAGVVLALIEAGCKKDPDPSGNPDTASIVLNAEIGDIKRMFFINTNELIVFFGNQVSVWDWAERKREVATGLHGTYSFKKGTTSVYTDNNTIPLKVELKNIYFGISYLNDPFHFSGPTPTTYCRFIVMASDKTFLTAFINKNKLYRHHYNLPTGDFFAEDEIIDNFYTYTNFTDATPLLTPDDKILICPIGQEIKLFSLETNAELLSIDAHTAQIKAIEMSSDGKRLISISSAGDLKIWSIPDGALVQSLTVDTAALLGLALSPDEKRLCASSSSGKIWIWKFPEMEQICGFDSDRAFKSSVLTITRNNQYLLGAQGGAIRIWDLQTCEYIGFLFQKAANYESAITYTSASIIYTLPCGSSIPSGAICTCNCVTGDLPNPNQSGGSGSNCTCDLVCTCIPVCQAHRLLHKNAKVRVMAEEILLTIGKKEWDYFEWALAGAKSNQLKNRIRQLMALIENKTQPNPGRWPATKDLEHLLAAPDPVVSLMAAQLLEQKHLKGQSISPNLLEKATNILFAGQKMYWRNQSLIANFNP